MPEIPRHAEAPEIRPEEAAIPSGHSSTTSPDEGEIDQILADSFPASDTPPWTLSVAETGRSGPPRK